MNFTKEQIDAIVLRQQFEITEYHVYLQLANKAKDNETKQKLQEIALCEKKHYDILKEFSGKEVSAKKEMIRLYTIMARVCGLHFTLHFMERGEEQAQESYQQLLTIDPVFKQIQEEEEEHEHQLISMIDSNVMKYVGSFVLGLNDAIVEVTGTVAGLTMALGDTRLIGMVGLIGGIAAAMSMAGSEYLSTKEEGGENPRQASLVTGIAYVSTVGLLIWPFFVMTSHFTALIVTLVCSVIVIALFNFYIAIAKNISFMSRFVEMTGISLGVAGVSFLIGEGISRALGISI